MLKFRNFPFKYIIVNIEISKNNDERFSYRKFVELDNDLDNLISHEFRYYVESVIRAVDSPFIDPSNKKVDKFSSFF